MWFDPRATQAKIVAAPPANPAIPANRHAGLAELAGLAEPPTEIPSAVPAPKAEAAQPEDKTAKAYIARHGVDATTNRMLAKMRHMTAADAARFLERHGDFVQEIEARNRVRAIHLHSMVAYMRMCGA